MNRSNITNRSAKRKRKGNLLNMRVLLQNTNNLLYWSTQKRWIKDMEQAADFQHVAKAVELGVKGGLDDVQIVLSFGDPRYDIRLPTKKLLPSNRL